MIDAAFLRSSEELEGQAVDEPQTRALETALRLRRQQPGNTCSSGWTMLLLFGTDNAIVGDRHEHRGCHLSRSALSFPNPRVASGKDADAAMFKQAARVLRQQLDAANLSKASRDVTFLCVSLERAAAYAAPSARTYGSAASANLSNCFQAAVCIPTGCLRWVKGVSQGF